nr:SMR family transporter [Rubellimicrobium sp. CFH 75288]
MAVAVVCEVIATSLLHESRQFTRLWPTLGMASFYLLAFYLLSLTLRVLPVGVVYAVWSGLGVVLISLVGWLVFRQALDPPAILGIGLILAGVLVLNLWSTGGGH